MSISEKDRELIRKARCEYNREWARKNPDKRKAAEQRYWLKKAREIEAREAAKGSEQN
jgi:hypothetical protein